MDIQRAVQEEIERAVKPLREEVATLRLQIGVLEGIHSVVNLREPSREEVALSMACEAFDVTPRKAMSRSQDYESSAARAAYAWILVRIMGYTMTRAGKVIGRDQSTISAAIRRIEDRKGKDAQVYKELYANAVRMFGAP